MNRTDTDLDDDLNRYPTIRYLDNPKNNAEHVGMTPVDMSEYDVLDEIDK